LQNKVNEEDFRHEKRRKEPEIRTNDQFIPKQNNTISNTQYPKGEILFLKANISALIFGGLI